MTGRERVLTALDHREPDRVPLDLGGSFVTSIAATSLDRLRRHLGFAERPVKVYDCFQMLGEVELDLVERLDLDCLPIDPPALTLGLRRADWKPWTLMDGTEVLVPGQFNVTVTDEGDWLIAPYGDNSRPPTARMPRNGFYFDTIGYGDFHPDWEPPPIEETRKASEGWLARDEDLAWFADHARQLRQSTDKCLVLGCWGYAGVSYVGALVDFWCLLARDPGYVNELFAISTEANLKKLELLWEAVGDNADVMTFSGLDFGTQRSEWFRPEVFAEIFLPHFRRQFDWLHEHTTWRIFEHSCGSIANLVGMLTEAGLDALNPVQTSAAGMDPAWLKSAYGDRLSFWGGGVDTQATLQFGTPEEVRAEVAERLRVFGPGGGFVFCPVHNIQPNTPPENIVAAYDTARELGRYPLRIPAEVV